jgi:PEP-CTERM motif
MRKLLLMVALMAFLGVGMAFGDEIYFEDPATLHIGPGAGTSCAQGCGGDPNIVPTNHVNIFQNQGGGDTLSTPLLLIIGIPNDTTDLFGSTNPINGVTWYNPYSGYPGNGVAGSSAFATAGTYGLTSAVSNGFFGSMSSGEVYGFLTLDQPADNSNNFGNWAGAVSSINGITATNFGIYAFALSGGSLGPKGLVDVSFLNDLPNGTMFVAYGENITQTQRCNNHGCTTITNVKIFDTPFTEAGDGQGPPPQVPEPGSLMLFGTGLFALAGKIRRKLKA